MLDLIGELMAQHGVVVSADGGAECIDPHTLICELPDELASKLEEKSARMSDQKANDAEVLRSLKIARVCHQANKSLCEAFGDMSQPNWEDAPQWQRESAVAGVKFCRDNPDAPASANHDSWSAQKIADGWKYGPVKDPQAKTHPCLVAFDHLPPQQQAKDHVFKAIVAALS
ncbi:hypothetical protein LOC51_19960 [Rubrivivax sp. JA1024]|nr:hypothetical protein [Rubrivivax sp. JA1024]